MGLLPFVIAWLFLALISRTKRRVERKRQEKQHEENRREQLEREKEYNKKYYRTNVLVLKENLESNKAYFKDHTVYNITNYGDFVIGTFDDQGNVYSTNNKQIAEITLKDESEGTIKLLRVDELEELRRYNNDERFNRLLDKTSPFWICAEVDWSGRIADWLTGEAIARREYSAGECEKNAIGYGACFVCLQYQIGAHGKYADFYTSPIGTIYDPK